MVYHIDGSALTRLAAFGLLSPCAGLSGERNPVVKIDYDTLLSG